MPHPVTEVNQIDLSNNHEGSPRYGQSDQKAGPGGDQPVFIDKANNYHSVWSTTVLERTKKERETEDA